MRPQRTPGKRESGSRVAYPIDMSVSELSSSADLSISPEHRAHLLQHALKAAVDYLNQEDSRSVAPPSEAVAALKVFREPLPEGPADPEAVLNLLEQYA